ncbi:hypothetical protein BVTX09c15_134 [Bovine papular stomatitis virus]|uniref:Uncharacterized protein n=1 Tax=Bovine papular stomatitis virus TaxID=129727 RepID=A0A0E3T8G3_9POXV|nr:hypothetical protein BVTX09c15_001 [Bovine papular stomatitis virus]AKC03299.1 hypothetical protein BVTX09c15_134 [Bovine papular stomatitis virus]
MSALRRLAAAAALVALGLLLGALFRPAAPALPAAFVEPGPARADGSAELVCLVVGGAQHMAAVEAAGAALSPAYPAAAGVRASFASARKGPLLLQEVTVAVQDVAALDADAEFACVAFAGGFRAAAAYARPVAEWRRQLARLRREEL